MTEKYREITVFVAHAFQPKTRAYRLDEFRSAVHTLMDHVRERLAEEFPGFSVSLVLEMNDFLDRLGPQIERQLEYCHLGLVDISDNNPNVMYELGQMSARNTPHIVIKSRKSSRSALIPSDVSSTLVCFYDNIRDIEPLLFDNVLQICRRILLNAQSLPSGYFNDVWFPGDTRYIHVISSPEAQKSEYALPTSANYMYLDNLGDKDALLETMILLSRFYPRARTYRYSADDFPPRYIEDNLVVIGGPGELEGEGNIICRQMMQRVKSSVTYTDDCEVLVCDGKEYRASYGKGGQILQDYGYFARFPNPFDPTSVVILINGIHTFGVLGAARAFSDHPSAQLNIRRLTEALHYNGVSSLAFECFFSVSVVSGEVMVPEINIESLYNLA